MLVINAIQEMKQTAKEQETKINTLVEQQDQLSKLLNRIEKLKAAALGNSAIDLGDLDLISVSLVQNQPNPMNNKSN